MKIHYKLTLIFSFFFALIFFFTFRILNEALQQRTAQEILSNLKKQTLLAQTLIQEFRITDEDRIEFWDRIADEIGDRLNVRATVIAKDGVVLGDSNLTRDGVRNVENHLLRPEIQTAFDKGLGWQRRYSTTIRQPMLYMAAPFDHPRQSGLIRLAIPLTQLEMISDSLKKFLSIVLFLGIILAAVFSYIASAYFTRPLVEITRVAEKIARGEQPQRIIITSKDMIGRLAQSINHMADQVRQRFEEVAAGRSQLEAVLLSMFEGVLVLNKAGDILLMNQSLKGLLHINDDPAGKNPLEVIRNIRVQEVIQRAASLTSGVYSSELTLFFPEEKTFLIHATPVVRSGERQGIILIFHEITELRRLEKIRQEFVANVSHELRTPLASIKGYAETLLEGALEDKENAGDFIQIIYSDADRLARLINDILDLSRIETGKFKLAFESYALQPLVASVIGQLKKPIRDKKIKVINEIPDNFPAVVIDEDRITQVFYNLIDNAVKYTPAGGEILISAIQVDGMIQVSVADNGIGIAEEHLPRIFERFYRVDKARSRELGGTGLGLAIVKHIVQVHGGEVSVSSKPGKGTTFLFTLPRKI